MKFYQDQEFRKFIVGLCVFRESKNAQMRFN